MLAGVKKRIAHHHQAYQRKSVIFMLLFSVLRLPCKMFATNWLACGKAAAIDGWGRNAVRKDRVTILPNAVDPEVFKFDETARWEIRSQYGIKDDDFVIGHVGRFYPQKNHEFLIEMFNEVKKTKQNAKLLLVGDGPLQESIRKKVDSMGLIDSVVFAGVHRSIAPFYSAMDVFCFPSLYEGFGLVLLEAEYNGLPCLVNEGIPKDVQISRSYVRLCLEIKEWLANIYVLKRNFYQTDVISDAYDINVQSEKLVLLYLSSN